MFFPPQLPHCLETTAGEVSAGFQPTRPMSPAPSCARVLPAPGTSCTPHSSTPTHLSVPACLIGQWSCSLPDLSSLGAMSASVPLCPHTPHPNLAQCLAGGRCSVDICQMSHTARGEVRAGTAEQVSVLSQERCARHLAPREHHLGASNPCQCPVPQNN